MEIVVKRVEYSTTYTIGKLYINKVFQCWTLEDKVREHGIKIPVAGPFLIAMKTGSL